MKKGTSNTLTFTYDASGAPLTVTWNGTKYYYTTNIQGDVVAILNADGTTAASYTYDAWGKCLNSYTSGIGFLNPLRYRSYVYDEETQLYYLQSRYYDPAVGRFLNADVFYSTGQGFTGYNTFVYCNNRPIISADYNGYDAIILLNEDGITHLGIMVQDESGTWWHFYWGASSFSSALFGDAPAQKKCNEYTGELTVDAINAAGLYEKDYEYLYYLTGDFSSCVSKMEDISENYNLLTNNCSQVSLRILAEADTEYKNTLSNASSIIFPSRAFFQVKIVVEGIKYFKEKAKAVVQQYATTGGELS